MRKGNPFKGAIKTVSAGQEVALTDDESSRLRVSLMSQVDPELVEKVFALLAAQPAAPVTVSDEAAMRVALLIMANLEDRSGVLDGIDDEIKQEIADEIAVTIKTQTFPASTPAEDVSYARSIVAGSIRDSAPKSIFLIVGDGLEGDEAFDQLDGVTWCADSQFDSDIEYVRADIIAPAEDARASRQGVALSDNWCERMTGLLQKKSEADKAKGIDMPVSYYVGDALGYARAESSRAILNALAVNSTTPSEREELRSRFPEINFSNYGQDEVEALQAWAFEAYGLLSRASSSRAEVEQAVPESIRTNAPDVSREHIIALAKLCNVIGAYTTAEWVGAVVGFVRVVLDNPAVQEAFVRANPDPTGRMALLDRVCHYADSVSGMLRQGGWPGKADTLERLIKAVIDFDAARLAAAEAPNKKEE